MICNKCFSEPLGRDEHLPKLDVLEALERWIVIAYGGNKRPDTINTIPQLRWYLFSKSQLEAEKLPQLCQH